MSSEGVVQQLRLMANLGMTASDFVLLAVGSFFHCSFPSVNFG